MVSSTASTRQPPAGGPKATTRLDDLLHGLRRGERDAFTRYFRLFRAPVYDLARRLLGDDESAVAATNEALVAAFRRVVLEQDAADLETLTYRSALETCEARAGATEPPRREGVPAGAPLKQRFEAALETLDLRQGAALLLHDVQGMDAARTAAVLGLGEDAAAALLFRARERFRSTLHAQRSQAGGASCRQAEEAVAGAVGLRLTADELSRLRRHAVYCRPCRGVMKSWGPGAPAGLAAVLVASPLPEALAATPVFGSATEVTPAAWAAPPRRRAPPVSFGAGPRRGPSRWPASRSSPPSPSTPPASARSCSWRASGRRSGWS
jgi:RNA polymerase sigma-70 factor (ECF subfamily)